MTTAVSMSPTLTSTIPTTTTTRVPVARTARLRPFLAPAVAGLLGASAAVLSTWAVVSTLTLHMSF